MSRVVLWRPALSACPCLSPVACCKFSLTCVRVIFCDLLDIMTGVLLPSSLDEACELSLEAFVAAVDDDSCEEVVAMLVKVLVEQGVRSVRRLLNAKVIHRSQFSRMLVCCP